MRDSLYMKIAEEFMLSDERHYYSNPQITIAFHKGDVATLEKIFQLRPLMQRAVIVLRNCFQSEYGVTLPAVYCDEMLRNDELDVNVDGWLQDLKTDVFEHADLLMTVLEEMHYEWMRIHGTDWYMNEKFTQDFTRLLPFYMLPWGYASWYLEYLRPILEDLGFQWNNKRTLFGEVYHGRARQFAKEHSIYDIWSLTRYLSEDSQIYDRYPARIQEAIRQDRDFRRVLVSKAVFCHKQ